MQAASPPHVRLVTLPNILLAVGLFALVLPTMIEVAKVSWATEQGGHGPIVLGTGIWLLWRELKSGKPEVVPGKFAIGLAMLAPLIAIFVICIGTATLTAWVGLSLALGAFLARMGL